MAKKTSKKKTSKKTTTASRGAAKKTTTASRSAAKKTSSKKTTTAKAPEPAKAKAPARKAKAPARKAKVKRRAKKTTATKSPATKDKGKCDSGTCSARKLDGRSLLDRARECKDLEECRGFIHEFSEAVEQANAWLDEMHTQALSAEHTRDLYGEQISDLMEAIAVDERRIAQLEAELKKQRAKPAQGRASKAVLDKLAELHKEVRTIKTDLGRLLEGEAPTAERRRRVRQAAREEAGEGRGRGRRRKAQDETPRRAKGSAPMEERPKKRAMDKRAGPFAKYSVLRGAACSLGVGKYGYPPDVCAPASFSRSEAAEILGTYAQNKYAGLAKWALITGLPIDDVAIPLVPAAPQGTGKGGRRASKKTSSTTRRKKTAKVASNDAPRTMAARTAPKKTAKSGRSNQQIIDQVLLTVARI